jgi:hypothetical protein
LHASAFAASPDDLRGQNEYPPNRKANKLVIAHPKAPSAGAGDIAESSAQEIAGLRYLFETGQWLSISKGLPVQHLTDVNAPGGRTIARGITNALDSIVRICGRDTRQVKH